VATRAGPTDLEPVTTRPTSPILPRAAATAALLLGLGLAASPPADAHLPANADALARSRSVDAEFIDGDEVFVMDMHLESGAALPLDVLVPPQDHLREHRPALALLGPGLPAPRGDTAAQIPGGVPLGAGVWVQWNDAPERPVVYEPTTRRVFWGSPAVALPLQSGDYEVRVWSPEGTTGPFSVGVGVDDDPLRQVLLRLGPLDAEHPSS